MSLVTYDSIFDNTILEKGDLEKADTVLIYAPNAEERMRDVLTSDTVLVRRIKRFGDFQTLTGRNRGDIYDWIVDGLSPWDDEDKERLRVAETIWAFAASMPSMNLRPTDGGGFVTATGFDQSRVNYKTESDIAQTQEGLQSQAVQLAKGLLSRHDRHDPDPVYIL